PHCSTGFKKPIRDTKSGVQIRDLGDAHISGRREKVDEETQRLCDTLVCPPAKHTGHSFCYWWASRHKSDRCDRSVRRTSRPVDCDKIYVAGGIDDTDFLNTVEVYDPDTNRWTFVAPMLSERRWFACVPFHGYLYVLGGNNRISYKLSTEKYDPAEDTWTEIPDMDFKYRDINGEVIDDMIFISYGKECYKYKENRLFVSLFVCSGLYNHKLLLSKCSRK
ncbi:kelch-like protein 10, partial [Zootermopsis nevadensis]|uniref:kelch-like protein 10 n=1 Tax=Zootermopsis nevadensis TaxID=136037 RepID=UPI000B8E70F9